ncbi:MAG: class I SAM-dependent methyltransferase [Rubrobacteraceae bacterium]|nr:class I SAM-dependent methyltransferase [Rubrobacteraceae bacterium]
MALPESIWGQQSASRYLAPVEEYKRTVLEAFPQLPKEPLDNCSIFAVDAIFLGYFLETLPRKVSVVEIGSFVGTSAFCFASHPNVAEVTCIDPNLPIADELTANSDTWKGRVNLEPLKDLKPFDVAYKALARFEKQREKINFLEGVAGTTQVGAKLGTMAKTKKVEIPAPSDGVISLVYVDGLHTREGVLADLEAVFGRNPEALAILDDCRHAWGPFVQAGIVDFMESVERKYLFRLVADLNSSLGTSNLGVLYPESLAQEVEKALTAVTRMFGRRLDLLRLLRREEELVEAVNRARQETIQAREDIKRLREKISRLQQKISRLQQKTSQLQHKLAHYQNSRRYKVADAAAKLLGR